MPLTLDKDGKKKEQAAIGKPLSHDAEHLMIIDDGTVETYLVQNL